jgi:hypothetical protein
MAGRGRLTFITSATIKSMPSRFLYRYCICDTTTVDVSTDVMDL